MAEWEVPLGEESREQEVAGETAIPMSIRHRDGYVEESGCLLHARSFALLGEKGRRRAGISGAGGVR